jgi:hypothetical protein
VTSPSKPISRSTLAQDLVQSLIIDMPSLEEVNGQLAPNEHKRFINDHIRWTYIKILLETTNVEFLKQVVSQMSFVLLLMRKITSRELGHLRQLSTGDESISIPSWIGYERFIDDVVSVILERVLHRIVELNDSSDHDVVAQYADFMFEENRYDQSLKCYIESYRDRIMPEGVINRCISCLESMQNYTAAFVMRQKITDHGYDKRMVTNLSQFNGIQSKWLPYLWDMAYIELVVYLTHQKGDNEKQKLLTQHVQRTEMNVNNNVGFRKQFADQLWKEFLDKLLVHVINK